MTREIRFGAFMREVTLNQRRLSYSDLAPAIQRDRYGNELPYRPPRLTLRPVDVYRLLQPYVSVRFWEQAKAVYGEGETELYRETTYLQELQ